MKAKYVVLWSNALVKLQNARAASRDPALMENCLVYSHISWSYQSTKWFVISPLLLGALLDMRFCGTRELSPAKNADMKCIHERYTKI